MCIEGGDMLRNHRWNAVDSNILIPQLFSQLLWKSVWINSSIVNYKNKDAVLNQYKEKDLWKYNMSKNVKQN